MFTIVGLGLGEDALTKEAASLIEGSDFVLVQTQAYAVCREAYALSPDARYLDAWYEESDSFSSFNQRVTEEILTLLQRGSVALCVLGDGMTENLAARLAYEGAKGQGVSVRVLPGISVAGAALSRTGVPATEGYRLCMTPSPMGDTGLPLLCPQVGDGVVLSEWKVALLETYPPEHRVWVVDPMGEEEGEEIPLYRLDRPKEQYPPYLTVVVPPLGLLDKERFSMEDFLAIVEWLRSPEGCPWDREQTHSSLRSNLLEEAYEVLGAISEEDPQHLAEELGDVLLQIALHAVIADQHSQFTFRDVTTGIAQKMIRRHPHVFGTETLGDSDAVLVRWEEIKEQERGAEGGGSLLDGAGKGLPSLKMAEEVQKRARQVGFDWADPRPAAEKVQEELAELLLAEEEKQREGEAGDLLFSCVNLIRLLQLDPDTALFSSIEKFRRRFRLMEEWAQEEGIPLAERPLSAMNSLWERAKEVEKREKEGNCEKNA